MIDQNDFVVCQICKRKFRRLGKHVRVHNITLSEYKSLFPNSRTISINLSNELSKKISKGRKGIIFTKTHKKNLSLSHLGFKPTKETVEKRRVGLKKHWADPIKHAKHKTALNRPEVKRKMSKGRKRYFANMTEKEHDAYCERRREIINKPEVKKKHKRAVNRWWETATEEQKNERIRKQQKGSNTPEVRKRRSISLKNHYKNPDARKKNSEAQKIAQNRPDVRRRKNKTMEEKYYSDPKYHEKLSKAQKKIHNKPEMKEKFRIRIKKWWNSLTEGEKEILRQKNSESNKKRWTNYSDKEKEERIRKMAHGRALKPNKSETYLIELITKYHLPFKYWGNTCYPGLGGRKPDFVSTDGSKKIIEYDGWLGHNPNSPFINNPKQRDYVRNKFYESKGYEVLSLNRNDLKLGEEHILNKILEFMVD